MTAAVDRLRAAIAARGEAQDEVLHAAAAYIDRHSELDATGEWKRMQNIFGQRHYLMWDSVEIDEYSTIFYKTTSMGRVEHRIEVVHEFLDDGTE